MKTCACHGCSTMTVTRVTWVCCREKCSGSRHQLGWGSSSALQIYALYHLGIPADQAGKRVGGLHRCPSTIKDSQ